MLAAQGVIVCIPKITINLELILHHYTNNTRILQLYSTPFLACAIFVIYFTSMFGISCSIHCYCFCFKQSSFFPKKYFAFEIIIDSQEVAKLVQRILCVLQPPSPSDSILPTRVTRKWILAQYS